MTILVDIGSLRNHIEHIVKVNGVLHDIESHYSLNFHLQPPIVVLNVIVIAAEGLEAKDINGYSDPYCMLGIQPASKSKPLPLDDGGVYCGDEDDDNENVSRNTADAIPKITIASGSSISITIAGDSSIGGGSAPRYAHIQSVRKSSKMHLIFVILPKSNYKTYKKHFISESAGCPSGGNQQESHSMVGQGIPVQRTSKVVDRKGSFKRNQKNNDKTEAKDHTNHSSNTSLRPNPRYIMP